MIISLEFFSSKNLMKADLSQCNSSNGFRSKIFSVLGNVWRSIREIFCQHNCLTRLQYSSQFFASPSTQMNPGFPGRENPDKSSSSAVLTRNLRLFLLYMWCEKIHILQQVLKSTRVTCLFAVEHETELSTIKLNVKLWKKPSFSLNMIKLPLVGNVCSKVYLLFTARRRWYRKQLQLLIAPLYHAQDGWNVVFFLVTCQILLT